MINWIYRRSVNKGGANRNQNLKDGVTITLTKSSKTKDGDARSLAIKFGEEVHPLLSIQGYISIGIDDVERRIYFKEADQFTGFKLSVNPGKNKDVKRMHVILNEDDLAKFKNYVGSYKIELDEASKLYYVSYANKLV